MFAGFKALDVEVGDADDCGVDMSIDHQKVYLGLAGRVEGLLCTIAEMEFEIAVCTKVSGWQGRPIWEGRRTAVYNCGNGLRNGCMYQNFRVARETNSGGRVYHMCFKGGVAL